MMKRLSTLLFLAFVGCGSGLPPATAPIESKSAQLSEAEYCALFDSIADAVEDEFERAINDDDPFSEKWIQALALLVQRSLEKNALHDFNQQQPEAASRCHARFSGRMAGLVLRGMHHAHRRHQEKSNKIDELLDD